MLVTDKPENEFHVTEFTPSELLLLLESHGFQVSPAGVFGQAYQPVCPSTLLTKAFRKLVTRPFASAELRPVRNDWSTPNYFVLRATCA